MLQVTENFKSEVVAALIGVRGNFTSTDTAFSRQWGINNSIYSRLKSGERANLLKEEQWVSIGRQLGVTVHPDRLKFAKTEVFYQIEEEVKHCQQHSRSMMFADESEIGKSVAARQLARHGKNLFYLDASQAKKQLKFVRLLAKTVGVDAAGTQEEVKERIKHMLNMLETPCVIIDEAGDMADGSFLDLKEFWNATEFTCGWYLIGADGLVTKIDRGIKNKKPGFRELYSRFGSNYSRITPSDEAEKMVFYKDLITTVLEGNLKNRSDIPKIVAKSMKLENGKIGGLRRAADILILNQQ